MANKISVLIDVTVDRANKALTDFRKSVSEADGATGKLKAGAQSLGDTFKANMVPIMASAGVAFAGFAVKAVKSASDLEESTNAVNKSFGDAAESVLALGEDSAKGLGMSKAAFNEAAVAFSAFAKNIAGPGGDVADVIDTLTTRSADFASVMNIDVAEASTVFRSGLSGETEPLKRFGIDLSAAAVEAYALANGLVESKSEMTEAIKVQARYGLLLQKTDQFAGDFADTSDGLANSTRIMNARIEDFQAEVGEQLIPTVTRGVDILLKLADAADAVGLAANQAEDKIGDGGFLGAVTDAINPIQAGQKALNSAQYAWEYYTGAADEATVANTRNAQSMVEASIKTALLEQNQENVAKSAEEAAEATERMREARDEATDAIRDAIRATDDLIDATLSAIDSSLGFRNAQADAGQAITDYYEKAGDATTTTQDLEAAQRDAEGAILSSAAAAVKLAEDQAAAAGATFTAEDRARTYRDELFGLMQFTDGPLREALQRYIDQLNSVPRSIYTNIGTTRSGDLGPMVTGRRAAGGPVSAGGAYLVGENGPEILQMGSTGGNVIPNNQIGGGGIVINVAGLTGPQVADDIVNKIVEYKRRNGGLPW